MTRSDNHVLKFGIVTVVTDSSIPTVDLAQWAEDRGFESLFDILRAIADGGSGGRPISTVKPGPKPKTSSPAGS